jgi:Type III restriction enzyme, res subunit/Helicase conserved C-terminal domain
MANLTFPELNETKGHTLPSASQETLIQLREDMCSQSTSRDFKLQNYQRFLRRVLSPDSPVRCLLMVHGTGTGKTCTAIQIAEEYIIRPEFQDKRVLVLANPAVQENFKTQIFAMSKVSVDPDGILLSKQCTGRRYLDMLLRIQSEPLKWTDKASRERMNTIAQRIISEFYEFQGYRVFANMVNEQELLGGMDAWIHKNFDDRLIIIDEAHSIRNPEEGTPTKLISMALDRIIKTAKNVTLILLTATPMFDSYDEIIFYFNLFLWNDRRQPLTSQLQPSKVFTKSGNFQTGMKEVFRGWCQDYVSFVRGDNPLTFPFRLPPPVELIAAPATRDMKNRFIPVEERRSVLTLTHSYVYGIQAEVLKSTKEVKLGFAAAETTICVFPENASFRTTFRKSQEEDSQYEYDIKFLAPSKVAEHSSKFALITKLIKKSKGVIFVYSNLVESGAQLFAMCLEEHGYESAIGTKLLRSTANEVERGSMGKYILFTSDLSETERRKALDRVKSPDNVEGQDVKIIVASPSISEGVDLSYVRQVHVLEYWWNMSRIEQVVGRGIRTCSHQALPFVDQNCTVYLHICKLPDSDRELIDEFYYRTMVEAKAKSIATVKHVIMESAMDCPLQTDINSLPTEWRNLKIEQHRSEDNRSLTLSLGEMASPVFGEAGIVCNIKESKQDPDHERPLSAYIDVRDEILDKFMKLFMRKPIWTLEALYSSPQLRIYDKDVILYTLHNAIETGFQLKDRNGRIGFLESKGSMYAFTLGEFNSMQDRYIKEDKGAQIPLEIKQQVKVETTLEDKREKLKLDDTIKSRFDPVVLDWYILDHEMTPQEKIQHMLTLDWNNPPIYAKILKVGDLKILGSKQIYNEKNEHITPIGKQADDYHRWVKQRIDLYLASRTQFFAAMQDGRISFNLDEKSDDLKRSERTKVIKIRACGSFLEPLLNKFAIWLGFPIPDSVTIKTARCQFLALAIRQAILDGKKKDLMWWTPEEWSIFDEESNRKDILLKLKA